MKSFFNSIRWLLSVAVFVLAFALLIGGSVLATVASKITNPDTPKGWISEGQIYEHAVEAAVGQLMARVDETLADAPQSARSQSERFENIIKRDEIADEVTKVFPPEWIQTQAEAVIDSIYAVIYDESDQLDFVIDLRPVRQNGQQVLGDLFKRRVAELPDCTAGISGSTDQLDIFSATCLPQGVSRSELNSTIDREIKNFGLFSQDQLTAQDTKLEAENLYPIRRAFGFLRIAPLIILGLILLFAGILYLLVPGKKQKSGVLGTLFGSVGLIILTISLLVRFGAGRAFEIYLEPKLTEKASAVSPLLRPLLQAIANDLSGFLMLISLIILALSAVMFYRLKRTE